MTWLSHLSQQLTGLWWFPFLTFENRIAKPASDQAFHILLEIGLQFLVLTLPLLCPESVQLHNSCNFGTFHCSLLGIWNSRLFPPWFLQGPSLVKEIQNSTIIVALKLCRLRILIDWLVFYVPNAHGNQGMHKCNRFWHDLIQERYHHYGKECKKFHEIVAD